MSSQRHHNAFFQITNELAYFVCSSCSSISHYSNSPIQINVHGRVEVLIVTHFALVGIYKLSLYI